MTDLIRRLRPRGADHRPIFTEFAVLLIFALAGQLVRRARTGASR